MDSRPTNCRFRLQDEGKAYPRSSCQSCGKSITTGLGTECTHNRYTAPELRDPTSGLIATRTDGNRLWYLGELAKIELRKADADAGKAALITDIAARFEILLAGPRPKDYSEEPVSLSEHKASKSSKAEDWTARDALIEVLRKVDNGDSVEDLIVVYRSSDEHGRGVRFANTIDDMAVIMGVLDIAKIKAFEGGLD